MLISSVPRVKTEEKAMVFCAGCERPIQDRFLLNVLEQNWHAACVQCFDCRRKLTDKCFSRDGKLYCKDDFYRRYGTKCGGCGQGILPEDLVRHARNRVYHLRCFLCMVCRKELRTGEDIYVLDEHRFICKQDYLNGNADLEDDATSEVLEKLDDTISEKDVSMDGEDSRDSRSPTALSLSNSSSTHGQTGPVVVAPHHTPPSSGGQVSSPSSASPVPVDALKLDQQIKLEAPIKFEADDSELDLPSPSGGSNNNNNKENVNKQDGDDAEKSDSECNSKDEKSGSGSKRRGPRTTIKAKQLEVLKSAFAATPKPTRHIREQLAQETGLNMRVIQVWFQNRRSKERRMKQLSALGARRAFFRNPRRMRGLQGEAFGDGPDMMQPPFGGYMPENGEFYGAYPGYGDYFPGQDGPPPPPNFLAQSSQGTPPLVDHHPTGLPHDSQFGAMSDLLPGTTSPEPPNMVSAAAMMHAATAHDSFGPPRSMAGPPFTQHPPPPQEMAGEAW